MAESRGRSLSDFVSGVQMREIKDALHHYTVDGPMGQLLDAEEERADTAQTRLDGRVDGRVEFKDVSFDYGTERSDAPPLIQDLNLRVEPGQTAAIVGPTGAGKTTLVNLLMRFYEIDAGRITLDGVDIRRVTRESLRANMAVVFQENMLFNMSIRENIRLGKEGATDEEVEEDALEGPGACSAPPASAGRWMPWTSG